MFRIWIVVLKVYAMFLCKENVNMTYSYYLVIAYWHDLICKSCAMLSFDNAHIASWKRNNQYGVSIHLSL